MRRVICVLGFVGCVGCGSDREPSAGRMEPRGQFGFGDLPPGPVVSADRSPPAISGGTLLVTRDGRMAVASDPDRDRVYLVNLDERRLTAELPLEAGDEPGRAVEDGARRVHVVLRGAGSIATIDLASARISSRRPICVTPRGIAFDPSANKVHVACQSGELVSIGVTDSQPSRVLELDRDLRDVVVVNDALVVSRFRSAELLFVNARGELTGRSHPGPLPLEPSPPTTDVAAVAWRTLALPSGQVAMIHQLGTLGEIVIDEPRGYSGSGLGSPCGSSVIGSAVSTLDPVTGVTTGALIPFGVLPVDLAVSPDGAQLAYIAAGNSWNPRGVSQAFLMTTAPPGDKIACRDDAVAVQSSGEAVAVAFDGQGRLLIQSRQPAQLSFHDGSTVRLSDIDRSDTGLALFHMDSGGGIACASCHPEGQDDGRVWTFSSIGPRRTQNVSGGFLQTAPFHWGGDLTNFAELVHDVFARRMGGGNPSDEQLAAFEHWVQSIPALPVKSRAEPNAVARGKVLFESVSVGCAKCHSGALLTDNRSYDVGTGGMFQVPSLRGIAVRAPYLHNGCAATLQDRFGACGGDKHGQTSGLPPEQITDLVAYLQTL